MRTLSAILLVVAGVSLASIGLSPWVSAGTTATVTVTFSILPSQMLTLSTDHVDFGLVAPGVSTPPREIVLTVRSNSDYLLSYTATDFTDGTGRTVPVSRLSPDGGLTPLALSGVITAGAGSADEDRYVQSYVLTVEPGDPAGTFVGEISYILSPR